MSDMAICPDLYWYLSYLGKPWKANPEPPNSYNCGELVRSIYRDKFGIESAAIPVTNAHSSLQCARAMQPEIFDLLPLREDEAPHEFDVCFMGRKMLMGHCGVAVYLPIRKFEFYEVPEYELYILHCPENSCGVTLQKPIEMKYSGFPNIRWFRHKDFCKC